MFQTSTSQQKICDDGSLHILKQHFISAQTVKFKCIFKVVVSNEIKGLIIPLEITKVDDQGTTGNFRTRSTRFTSRSMSR